MRGSDPDAALYWLAKMLYAGEDIRFIARRIVICASRKTWGMADAAGAGGRRRGPAGGGVRGPAGSADPAGGSRLFTSRPRQRAIASTCGRRESRPGGSRRRHAGGAVASCASTELQRGQASRARREIISTATTTRTLTFPRRICPPGGVTTSRATAAMENA